MNNRRRYLYSFLRRPKVKRPRRQAVATLNSAETSNGAVILDGAVTTTDAVTSNGVATATAVTKLTVLGTKNGVAAENGAATGTGAETLCVRAISSDAKSLDDEVNLNGAGLGNGPRARVVAEMRSADSDEHLPTRRQHRLHRRRHLDLPLPSF